LPRAIRIALGISLADLALVVMTGGVSILGPSDGPGFAWRLCVALTLVAADFLGTKGSFRHGYLVLLLLCLPLLHFRGYRLRGDGLWYYSFAHSVAFDGDIDLGNQYRRLCIESARGSQPVRETGRPR